MPRRRVALSIALAALTVLLGVGLIATSGYLVSRAAEQPPILSLTVTIVARPLLRPLAAARPLLSTGSSRTTWRSGRSGSIRARFYARIEPLAPAQLEGFRRGDLVSRMVGRRRRSAGPLPPGHRPTGRGDRRCDRVGRSGRGRSFPPPASSLRSDFSSPARRAAAPERARPLDRAGGTQRLRGELTADLVELLRGAPELVLYGREDDRLEAVRAADRELARHARRDAVVAGLGTGLLVLVAGLTTVGVLAAAVSAHASGWLDRVLVATVTLLALASFEGVAHASGRSPGARLRRSPPAAACSSSSTRRPSSPIRSLPCAPSGQPVRVALESVTARYSAQGPPVLDAFDLVIEPGRRVALVGESGAGKTTVTNLLFRFLDPESGRVTIGGRDVRDMRQEDVRRTFALAGQEAHVFNSTIRENLLLARPGATETGADRRAAARAARRRGSRPLPLGLDTLVGEEGSRLSGGQRQRLVLARALLVDAPVLVLDEPTAHLDPETAEELMRDIFATAGERSILLITHRREGLDLVDEIVELADGRGRRAR